MGIFIVVAFAVFAPVLSDPTSTDCTDNCVVGAHGVDELARRIKLSSTSCSDYAMTAVNPPVYAACGHDDVADIVAKCVSEGIDPQCYKHESAAIAFIVISNLVGVIVWVSLGAVALRESRTRRAASE